MKIVNAIKAAFRNSSQSPAPATMPAEKPPVRYLAAGYVSILDVVDPLIANIYAETFAKLGASPPTTPAKENPVIQEFVRMSQWKASVAAELAARAYRSHWNKVFSPSGNAIPDYICNGYCEQIKQRAAYYSTLADVEAVYVGLQSQVIEPLYAARHLELERYHGVGIRPVACGILKCNLSHSAKPHGKSPRALLLSVRPHRADGTGRC